MRRYNRNHKNNIKKERIVMIASSAFVLAALTMTGVYVKNSSEHDKNDGYSIDFSVLEKDAENGAEDILGDSPDAIPLEQVDSGIVQIPGLTDKTEADFPILSEEEANSIGKISQIGDMGDAEIAEDVDLTGDADILDEAEILEEGEAEDTQKEKPKEESAKSNTKKAVEPKFQAGDTLVWSVSGKVLIPYSMDRTVYFSTLEQYKYSPAMMISANEGDIISASAAGLVTNVFYDEEIGNAVTMDIGGGYEVTYGQLKEVAVEKGDSLNKDDIIGYVAAPTKYFSVEGVNAYFALTKDGTPVNPLAALQ